jgi:hypothetical protein
MKTLPVFLRASFFLFIFLVIFSAFLTLQKKGALGECFYLDASIT